MLLFILCVAIGAITGLLAAKLVHKTFRVWPQMFAGLAGSMFGIVLLEALLREPASTPQLLISSFLGAVAALLLAHSLRSPMGAS